MNQRGQAQLNYRKRNNEPGPFNFHAMPKNLLVDEVVRIGQGVVDAQDGTRQKIEGVRHV